MSPSRVGARGATPRSLFRSRRSCCTFFCFRNIDRDFSHIVEGTLIPCADSLLEILYGTARYCTGGTRTRVRLYDVDEGVHVAVYSSPLRHLSGRGRSPWRPVSAQTQTTVCSATRLGTPILLRLLVLCRTQGATGSRTSYSRRCSWYNLLKCLYLGNSIFIARRDHGITKDIRCQPQSRRNRVPLPLH